VDEHVTRQHERDAVTRHARAAAEKKEATRRAPVRRVPFSKMDAIEYSTLHQENWYEEECEEGLDDDSFWNSVQMLIHREIYLPMSQSVCPMHVIDFEHMRNFEDYFGEALVVTEKLGLHHLMGLQCHYNIPYI
jgi:hypothetical protein